MYKLINQFKIYLVTQNIQSTSIKNYIVDLKNFLEWFILHLKTNQIKFDEQSPLSICALVSGDKIKLYRSFLEVNNTAVKTINRRLSTLRRLGSFIFLQGWQHTNPARDIDNSGTKQPPSADITMLAHYKNDLLIEGMSKATVKNYLADIRQFLNFINSN